MASRYAALGNFLSDLLGQANARFVNPTDEATILRNITADAPAMARMAGAAESGFSYDPRTGRFLEPGSDLGSMMGTQRNLPGELGGAGTALTPADIISIMSEPRNMRRLQRGEYVGAWNPDGTGIGLDTSRRQPTQLSAMLSGARTGQLSGFNLGRGQTYDLNSPADWAKAAAKAGAIPAGLAGAGALAYDYGTDQDLDALSFLQDNAGLALAGVLPVVGGKGLAKSMAKDAAKTAPTDADKIAALERFVETARDPKWNKMAGDELAAARQDIMDELSTGARFTGITPNDVRSATETSDFLDSIVENLAKARETRGGMKKSGFTNPVETLPIGDYANIKNQEALGASKISVRGQTIDMSKVGPQDVLLHYASNKDVDGFSEAYAQMVNNQLSLYSPAKVERILRGEEPEFYPLARDYILSLSQITGVPPHVLGIGLAAASQRAAPFQESNRVMVALKLLKPSGGKVVVDTAGLEKVPEGQFAINSAKAMAEVINNPGYAHVVIPGIANKTWLYSLSKYDPENFGIYTNDSIDSFAMSNTVNTPFSITEFLPSLMGRTVGMAASGRAGVPGPRGQEIPWGITRVLRGDIPVPESFSPESIPKAQATMTGRFGEEGKGSRDVEKTLARVSKIAQQNIDDLMSSGAMGGQYSVTDQGILVPNIRQFPELLVPNRYRTPESVALERMGTTFARRFGGY